MLTLFALQLVFWFAVRRRMWPLALCAVVPVVYYTDVLLAMHLLDVHSDPKLITVLGNVGFSGVMGWAYFTARRREGCRVRKDCPFNARPNV